MVLVAWLDLVTVFRTWKRQDWPLPGPPQLLEMEKDEKAIPTEAIGRILAADREGKVDILCMMFTARIS